MANKRKANKTKKKLLPFGHRLVLNQWLIEQCGYDPLAAHKQGQNQDKGTFRPLQGLASILRNCPEGLDTDNRHYFYKQLDVKWKREAEVTRGDLSRYEENIFRHTDVINRKRPRPIIWKYYQWLSLLFAEIYLERYFGGREALQKSLNRYVERFNNYWQARGFDTGVSAYRLEDLNKICLQNATGSGKTLLMHANFLQFRHCAQKPQSLIERALLITPNEGLSRQHQREMTASGIFCGRLQTDRGDLFASVNRCLQQIDFTEITKLSEQDGPNQIAVRSLGDKNLLLVDEAHRGMGSIEETGWFKSRERLVEKGFVFEYSATFKEAITAAKRPEIDAAYAKNILFDYSYRYFYEDGYGKDYRIFNLPKSYAELRFTYLTACLLSFYQQLKLYQDKKTAFRPYNLEKPLWVFVGKSVSKATGTKDEKSTVSDVALILQFMANLLQDKTATAALIEKIIATNAEDTGLLDETGGDIFAGSFSYIRAMMRREGWTYRDLLRDIFGVVFLNTVGGSLTLAKIKDNDSEIMLRAGHANAPFGLINVGDATGLLKHIAQQKQARSSDFRNLNLAEAAFSETLFGQVHESSSAVTVLLGSKKFVEGWDCWRVSTLGLMHVGKSEGAQIIQLFGRGVRLKGFEWTLKRSSFATPTQNIEYIHYLETLNIFGVGADFMERFKKFLHEEGLPGNDERAVYTVPLSITHDFGKQLKVLRPRKKDSNGSEYDFKKDAKGVSFGDIPDKLKMIEIDWYPRIQALESQNKQNKSYKNATVFGAEHLAFLDYDDVFLGLEKFKRDRSWHNLNISKGKIRQLLENAQWYNMFVPVSIMTGGDIANMFLWQQMARELCQKYCEELVNYAKAAFMAPRLELRPLTREDANIPNVQEYQLIAGSSQQVLIDDILALQKDIAQAKPGILHRGDLKACLFEPHLYQPVMHVAKNSKIHIAPVSLNESEFQFVEDLHKYLQSLPSSEQFYLLRNESRGKGIGFFEAGNFYPDFLLWKIKDDKQCIAFIEPHGLLHEGPGHKKIAFHKTIKDIQKRLSGENVCLNSFIVTPTRFSNLNWSFSIEKLKEKNVLFMQDDRDSYIASIVARMEL